MRSLALYLYFLVQPLTLVAQEGPEFSIRWFNTENGLPANGVKGIQWDPETEFAWIATEAGVVRFNGTELAVYTRNNTPFLFSERITFLVKNNKGQIYLAESSGSASRVERNRLAPYHIVKQQNNKNDISLYGLTVSEEYFNFLQANPPEQRFFLPFDKVANKNESSVYIVQAGNLYLNDIRVKGLKKFEGIAERLKNIFQIGSHTYLLDNQNKVSQFFSQAPYTRRVNCQLEGMPDLINFPRQAELYWENGQPDPILINGNKAWRLTESEEGLKGLLICKQVPTDAWIRNFLYIKELGLILIGTDSKGVAVLQRNSVTPARNDKLSNLESNSYYSQIELSDGSILTNHGHRIGKIADAYLDLPIKGNFGNSIYLTSDSLLWYQQYSDIYNNGAIFSYNYKTKERKVHEIKISGNSFGVWRQHDTTLVISNKEIKQLFPTQKVLLSLSEEKTLKADPITTLPIDNYRIAIASCNGLVFFDKRNNTTDTVLTIPNYCIRSLARFGDYLLIGTYGAGIYIHKLGANTVKVPLDKKQSVLYSHCFMTDKQGFCWISTNRGLLRAKVSDLLDAYDNPGKEIYYHFYGISDGMITSEMNGGCQPCALALKNGSISFPTMDGLLRVEPENVLSRSQSGQIFIDEISCNDSIINGPFFRLTKLPYTTRKLVIKLAYAAWANRENIYLYYRLRAGEPWKEVPYSNPSLIEINNLDPGNYELQIRKLNGFGVNNYTLLSLPFIIETPWFNKWWFYLIVTVLLYGVLLIILTIRTRSLQQNERKLKNLVEETTVELKSQNQILEKNNRIMSRLISIISHDIVTPLKFIHVAGKNLLKKKEGVTEELNRETLTEITHTAQELQELSTNILNWIRFQRKNRLLQQIDFQPYELAEQVIRILGPSARLKKLTLSNSIDPELVIRQYAEPFRILLHNLLSNAINFSEKGEIQIELSKVNSSYALKVKDEGVGMSTEQIENILQEDMIISSATVDNKKGHGLGYQIIKDLISLIEASISIHSQRGIGSEVTITFPSKV